MYLTQRDEVSSLAIIYYKKIIIVVISVINFCGDMNNNIVFKLI